MNHLLDKVTVNIKDLSFFSNQGQAYICFPDPDLSKLLGLTFGDTDFFCTIEEDAHDMLMSIMNVGSVMTYRSYETSPAVWSQQMSGIVFGIDHNIDIYVEAGCIVAVLESENV